MAATTVGAATELLDLANNTASTSLTFSMKMQLQHMASLATHKHWHLVSSPSSGAVNNELSVMVLAYALCVRCSEVSRGGQKKGLSTAVWFQHKCVAYWRVAVWFCKLHYSIRQFMSRYLDFPHL